MEAEGEIPEHLHPPELLPGMESWWLAFHELSCDRSIGMGVGPIPASSIERWTAGWPHDDAWAFRHCMREMDAVMLDHHARKTDRTTEPREIVNGEDRLRAIFGDRLG